MNSWKLLIFLLSPQFCRVPYRCNHVIYIQPFQIGSFHSAVQSLSRVWLCNTMDCSTPSFLAITISQSLLKFIFTESAMPSNHLILFHTLLLLPSILPSIRSFPKSQLFASVVKVLELQHQSFQWIFRADFLSDWLVWSPGCPRDSQESSPAPQFKCINSSVLRLLYGSTFRSIFDYWKNHSFDHTHLCQQSDVSAF